MGATLVFESVSFAFWLLVHYTIFKLFLATHALCHCQDRAAHPFQRAVRKGVEFQHVPVRSEVCVRGVVPPMESSVLSRKLNDDQQSSYLVDDEGNEYEPYSLAWRYLGMYIDCDLNGSSSHTENEIDRRLGGGGDGNDCSRKILWAAVRELSVFELSTGPNKAGITVS